MASLQSISSTLSIYSNPSFVLKTTNQARLFIQKIGDASKAVVTLTSSEEITEVNQKIEAMRQKVITYVDSHQDALQESDDKEGQTLLHLACIHGDHGIFNSLLKSAQDTDLNKPNKAGSTPLHLAAEKGDLPLVQGLLSKGAHVNPEKLGKGFSGFTPMHNAIRHGHTFVAQALYHAGTQMSNTVIPPLHWACQLGRLEITKFFVENAPELVHALDIQYRTPLHVLCTFQDSVEMAQVLLNAGANTDDNLNERSPLHDACEFEKKQLVSFLLQERPSWIEAKTADDKTPLHVACLTLNKTIIGHLLQAGASATATTRVGQTPLHCLCSAARHPSAPPIEVIQDIATNLLQHGAKLKASTIDVKITPLTLATPELQKFLKSEKKRIQEIAKAARPKCQVCQKGKPEVPKLKKCAGCLSVRYCSKTCQLADWNNGHKTTCLKNEPL